MTTAPLILIFNTSTIERFDSLDASTVLGIYLVGGVLQCHWANPGINFTILFDDGFKATTRGPLQDEAEGVENHAHKLNHIRVVKMTQIGDLSTYLHRYTHT